MAEAIATRFRWPASAGWVRYCLDRILDRAKALRAVTRLEPFDTGTIEGRSSERYRRVALTAGASVVVKSLSLLTTAVSVPLTIGYLGTESYGIWMTISSLLMMFGFADLGMGNGLLNALSAAHGAGDRFRARVSVSSVSFVLCGLALLTLGALWATDQFVSWPGLFNVGNAAASREVRPAVLVLITCIAINLPLGVVQRVQIAYQDGYVAQVWSGLGNAAALVGLLLAVYYRAGLPWLVLSAIGAPLIITALSWIWEFKRHRPWLSPTVQLFRLPEATRIAGTGLVFFGLQLVATVAFYADSIIIAHARGPAAVAGFAVVQKLFAATLLLQTMLVSPLWPAYGEALACGDLRWITRTFRRSLAVVTAIWAVLVLPLLLTGQPLVRLWTHGQVAPSFALLLAFGVWSLVNSYGSVLAACSNGLGCLKVQLVAGVLFAPAVVFLKYRWATEWGAVGVVWANSVLYVPLVGVPVAMALRSHLGRLQLANPR